MLTKNEITDWFKSLQLDICKAIEEADGSGTFIEDLWERPGGGGGRSKVLKNGNVIEKGGVNFSAVHGKTPANILKALQLVESDFYATGVSIVLHPKNPLVPIIHMNVRYFEMTPPGNKSEAKWWFGGGIDLTPHYIDRSDAAYFHKTLKEVCDRHNKDYYDEFKLWADDYFFLKHRNETRGVGGIFFDRLNRQRGEKDKIFNFIRDVGRAFAPIYTHFMSKNNGLPYGENEKEWQMLRRGRYVEFNLVWDKGTKFGLDTNGRTESILMSLPPQAHWEYNFQVKEGSKEQETLQLLKKEIDWVNQ